MLALHPDVAWPSQYSLRGAGLPGRRRLPLADLADGALRTLFRGSWEKGRAANLRRLVPRPDEASTAWRALLPRERPADVDLDRLRDIVQRHADLWRRDRFLAKWPWFNEFLPVLIAAFPDARVVHIVRDGRAVALSVRSKFARHAAPGDALRGAADYWVQAVTNIVSHPGANVIELRYEDLCKDVHGTLRQAMVHGALDVGRFPLERVPTTLVETNGSWLERASADDVALITGIQADLLARYGYAATPAR
jgi:hypothetical protein